MINHYIIGKRKPRLLMSPSLLLCSLLLGLGLVNPSYSADARQIKLLSNNCLQCHTSHESTAPIMGVAEDWVEVIEQGEELTLRNVVLGIGGMPPLGLCSACNENDFRVLTRLIAGFPEKTEEQR